MGEAGTDAAKAPPGPALPAATSLSFSGGSGEVEITIKAPEDFLVESDSRGALLRRADFPVTGTIGFATAKNSIYQ